MGLIDFVKNAGASLLGRDEREEEARHDLEHLDHAHQKLVDRPAASACGDAHGEAYDERDERRAEPHGE